MRRRRTIVFLLVVIALLGGVAAGLLLNPDLQRRLINLTRPTETVTDPAQINQMAIAYVAPPFVDDYGLMRVSGYIQNLSSSEIRSADISVQLFDEDGNKKEFVQHTVSDIGAGTRKTYDVNAGSIAGAREATITIDAVVVYK